jgi:hypothetical protein
MVSPLPTFVLRLLCAPLGVPLLGRACPVLVLCSLKSSLFIVFSYVFIICKLFENVMVGMGLMTQRDGNENQ